MIGSAEHAGRHHPEGDRERAHIEHAAEAPLQTLALQGVLLELRLADAEHLQTDRLGDLEDGGILLDPGRLHEGDERLREDDDLLVAQVGDPREEPAETGEDFIPRGGTEGLEGGDEGVLHQTGPNLGKRNE